MPLGGQLVGMVRRRLWVDCGGFGKVQRTLAFGTSAQIPPADLHIPYSVNCRRRAFRSVSKRVRWRPLPFDGLWKALRLRLWWAQTYGTLTEPLPIHAPPAVRMRKATCIALQPAVDDLNEPENSAFPGVSSGTSGVSITVGLAEPGPQTSVPLTRFTAPGVPIVLPPARTSPLTSNTTKPLSSSTKASPSRVDRAARLR
jgi:hypothetical protein